ncbi:MAG: heavy-metal-associated domain-containing protein [Acidilobus sp.]
MGEEARGRLRITRTEQLQVVGMHCATCVTTVDRALRSVRGSRTPRSTSPRARPR